MAISFPLAFPTTKGPRRIAIRAIDVAGLQASPLTREHTVYDWGGDGWELDIEAPPMKRADAEAWVVFLLKLRGYVGTFLAGDPVNTSPRGTWAGTPLLNGAHAAGVRTVALDGFTAAATGKEGDWLQFGTGASTRLHKVLEDFTANGAGQANVEIYPQLRAALLDNAAIVTASAKGRWRLASNVREYSIELAQVYGLRFSCIEARD